jgi:hypothetical protein
MRPRSARSSTPPYKNKRVLALLAAVVVCGGVLTVTQVAGASTWRRWGGNRPPQSACPPANAGGATQTSSASPTASGSSSNGPRTSTQNGRQVRQWSDDSGNGQQIRRPGRNPRPTCTPTSPANGSASPSSTSTTPPLDIQQTNCSESNLQAHGGFQDANRCVSTDHGEVGELAKNPTALIVEFPQGGVRVNTPFTITVSTQNIIRNRFLGAAVGGYYAEMDELNAQGFAQGHAHLGCRILQNTNEAPDPTRSDFFVALEDNAGSDSPDRIVVNVSGLPRAGIANCALWLGANSHRVPLMQFANSIPGFDAVRFQVRA